MIIEIFAHHSFRKQFAKWLGVRKLGSTNAPFVAQPKPIGLTALDAQRIGLGFDRAILTSAAPAEAVDEVLLKDPALAVMARQHPWFRPMLEIIAQRRMACAPLGLKLRLGISVCFSTADMVSDLYSTINMLRNGQLIGAYGMIGLISTSLAIQVLFSVVNNQHLGWKSFVREVVFVLLLVKPGLDAIRFASGAQQVAGAPLSPFLELLLGKVLEIACEAGPGAALQAYVVLGGGSTSAMLSVSISCLSVGFATAMMAFDVDTSPFYRKMEPNFYGGIPDDRRLLVFVELFALHTAHSMLKTLTVACLARTNWHWYIEFMVADLGVYIMYKVARCESSLRSHRLHPRCALHATCEVCVACCIPGVRRPCYGRLWAFAVRADSVYREDRPRHYWSHGTSPPGLCRRILLLRPRRDDTCRMLRRCCAVLRIRHWGRS
jgi:hypothetical protein